MVCGTARGEHGERVCLQAGTRGREAYMACKTYHIPQVFIDSLVRPFLLEVDMSARGQYL